MCAVFPGKKINKNFAPGETYTYLGSFSFQLEQLISYSLVAKKITFQIAQCNNDEFKTSHSGHEIKLKSQLPITSVAKRYA